MSLVTIQRSPTPSEGIEIADSLDSLHDTTDNTNEDFFAEKGIVVLQNQIGRRRSSIIKEEETVQCFLKKILKFIRHEDKLKLMVNIEKVNCKIDGHRYFCLISRNGNQDTEESLIIGFNISIGRATVGFVLPIYQDMTVKLDGDGGFELKYKNGEKHFKPTSVHALWTTVQLLDKACKTALQNNYYQGGLNHTWIGYYQGLIHSNRSQIAEWNKMLDADVVANSSLAPKSAIGEFVKGTEMDEHERIQEEIRQQLEEIMREEDMDNVTVTFLREKLQEKVDFKLNVYKRFIAEEILIIYGKMDEPSQILPYLFLGSTYNASNLEELVKNKITHILNVTRESENFFRDKFEYENVLVFDTEDTKLLKHFDACYKFINQAKLTNGACLVHCQRGISRSASIVISYIMKEFNMEFEKALEFVKKKRDCIKPNDGFMQQLKTYQGILQASSNRHNSKFQADKRKTYDGNEFTDKDLVDSQFSQNEKRSSLSNDHLSRPNISEIYDMTFVSGNPDQADDNNFAQSDIYLQNYPRHDFLETGTTICNNQSVYSSEILEMSESDCFNKNPEPCEKSFSTDFNANITPENIISRSASEKRSVKIKCDHSWIKSSSNCNEGESEENTPFYFSNFPNEVNDFVEDSTVTVQGTDSQIPPANNTENEIFG